MCVLHTLHVELGQRRYPIHIGTAVAEAVADSLREARQAGRPVLCVSDAGFAEAQPAFVATLRTLAPVLLLPSGETTKSMSHLERVYAALAEARVDRTGLLYAVGGGVIGDLAGYAAATWLRGIGFCQVPTTLLAMVDSAVGGKTGINIPAGKNLVGAFWQPQSVFAGMGFLATLPRREFAAGMAEVIKYGLLADAKLFEQIEQSCPWDAASPRLPDIVRRCCEIKASIVRDDEREEAPTGGRALLNLGHTFAHAIENAAGYGEYLHGEAVGIGLIMAARLSEETGNLDAAEVRRVSRLVGNCGLPQQLHHPLPLDNLLRAMRLDKKHRSGSLRFITLRRIGAAATTEGLPMALIEKLWLEFGASSP